MSPLQAVGLAIIPSALMWAGLVWVAMRFVR